MEGIPREQLEREVALTFPAQSKGRVALITLSREAKLNACTQEHYFRIANLLHTVAKMPDVVVTVVTGTGRFFSAGADVTVPRGAEFDTDEDLRRHWNRSLVSNNMHNTHAWYSHPKILVVALNGPAIGISAAFIGHADFVYAAPHAYLAVPFTSLGLVAEGGSSKAFVERLGISKALEALIQSRKIPCEDLLRVGFVNKVFAVGGGDKETGKGIDTQKFLKAVLDEVDDKLGPHLVKESMLEIKRQIRKPGLDQMHLAGLEEVWGGLDVFIKGVPQKEFAKIASGEKRHKL